MKDASFEKFPQEAFRLLPRWGCVLRVQLPVCVWGLALWSRRRKACLSCLYESDSEAIESVIVKAHDVLIIDRVLLGCLSMPIVLF